MTIGWALEVGNYAGLVLLEKVARGAVVNYWLPERESHSVVQYQ
jgi:hypothetical protein